MRRPLLLTLVLLAAVGAAPLAAAEPPSDDGEHGKAGPLCWRIDPSQVPPVEVWLCEDAPEP